MFIFILLVHIIIAVLLITIILMQSGRGGGLTETFSGMESIFGTKTNVFLVRATTVLAFLFLATCLSLAYLSTQRGRSLIPNQVSPSGQTKTKPAEPKAQATKEGPKQENVITETKTEGQQTQGNIETKATDKQN